MQFIITLSIKTSFAARTIHAVAAVVVKSVDARVEMKVESATKTTVNVGQTRPVVITKTAFLPMPHLAVLPLGKTRLNGII